jgi:hypothetical protein
MTCRCAVTYQAKGTINAQYGTYKLVVRDPKGVRNAVVSLAELFTVLWLDTLLDFIA